MPPGRTRSAAARSSSSWSSGSGCERQRRSGREASTPSPEHGASTRARSKPVSSGGSARPSARTTVTFVAPRRPDVLLELARAGLVHLDRDDLARQHGRLPARSGAEVEHALALDASRRRGRRAASRGSAARSGPRRAPPRPRARPPRRRECPSRFPPAARPRRAARRPGAGSFWARMSSTRLRLAEVAAPDLPDPVGVRVLQRALGQRREQRPDAVRDPAQHGVRERHGPLEPSPADELDGLVHRGVLRYSVEIRELVRAEPERRQDRRVELAHRPLAERLDRVVERPHALHRAERELPRERAVARVEPFRGAPQGAVGVRLVLEDAPQHLVRRAARRRDHRRPRRNSS